MKEEGFGYTYVKLNSAKHPEDDITYLVGSYFMGKMALWRLFGSSTAKSRLAVETWIPIRAVPARAWKARLQGYVESRPGARWGCPCGTRNWTMVGR
jgi:hypothetical protein